ncbi:membrane transporter [Oryctes borbonicus]|uniref:Membrane transporter n=1 Tax=Oryctes borbonicus TaxID=1629725 RepID=A0A0T6AZS0_9SCAR|nr:membrane transporter [Oryctes borbonicus]
MAQNGKTDIKFYIGGKPKRRRLRVGDPDFVPPDGGWGWLVVFACGFSNLSTYPMLQQFGLIFREKYNTLGITNTEMTTIFNLNSAATACIGLFNGPVFRRLSFRQYALIGTTTVAVSLFLTTFARSFVAYIILYAILYGGALGIAQTSNALALNTYFREKRRVATGLSWTTTGIGPILCPYVITFLMSQYGMEGTLSLFAAFAGNAIVCSLLLQPVHWHTEFREEDDTTKILINDKNSKDVETGHFENKLAKASKSRSLFSSQYFSNEDDRYAVAFDMVDPGTPMMIYANDGFYSRKSSFGSKMSLVSNKGTRSKLPSGQNSVTISNRPSYSNLADARKRKQSKSKLMIQEHAEEDCPTEKAPQDLKEEEKVLLSKIETPILIEYPNERDVLKSAAKKLTRYKEYKEIQALKLEQGKEEKQETAPEKEEKRMEEEEDKDYTFLQKLVMFFDLTLLKDYVYVNLMLGITIANFVELNFSILTPFVLKEFHFENFQIATFMSLLGATDVVCRFFIPFIADRMSWQNRSFFLLGVCCMAVGRIILVHTQTYQWSIFVALIIGFGKGLRTVFIALVIPSHVPLDKLPAASGLQLVTSGILFFVMGPVVGWIRDFVSDYVITLHILNILTYATAISWLTEKYLTDKKKGNAAKGVDTPKS